MFEFDQLLTPSVINLTLKIPLAVLTFLFFIFTLIVVSRVRTLNRSLQIYHSGASSTLMTIAIAYSIVVFFLFLFVLVIV